MNARIIAWGREGLALTASLGARMSHQARKVRLQAECSTILRSLDEIGGFGPWDSARIDSPRMLAIGVARAKLESAIRDYLRGKGGVEGLLLRYDAIMADIPDALQSKEG